MSKNNKIANEFIEKIESTITEGLDEMEFIEDFRKRIEEYLSDKLK